MNLIRSDYMYVSTNISTLIRYCSYTQQELSNELGIPQTHISRLLHNKEYPRLNDVISFSVFFKISTDDLIFNKIIHNYDGFKIIRR